MQFGANTFIWVSPFRTDTLWVIDRVADLGFDAVEVALEDASIIDVEALAQKIKHHDLSTAVCGAFGPDRDLAHEDSAIRDNAKKYIIDSLDFASRIGASIFCGPAYSAVGKARPVEPAVKEEEWKRAVTGLRELGDEAQKRGVTIAVETLNRFETDFLNLASQLKRFLEDVGHPAVRGHLDTFHMNIEEKDLGEAIRLMGGDLVHFHACENDRGAPGSGHVEWEKVRDALRDIGYDGMVVVESFTPGVKEIAKAAAIWRPLAKDEDTLAGEGLEFLRNLLPT